MSDIDREVAKELIERMNAYYMAELRERLRNQTDTNAKRENE